MLHDDPGAVRQGHQEPRAELRPADQRAHRDDGLHGQGQAGVPGGHARRSPSAAPTTRLPGQNPIDAVAALRDRARQRAGLGPLHQLPARTRTASTARPAPRSPARFTIAVRPGPGELPQDRRAADPPRADLALAGLGLAGQAGARPGPEGGHRGLHHRRALPADLLPRPRRDRGRRAGRLRAVLLRARQADPDRPDAAGHRGPDPRRSASRRTRTSSSSSASRKRSDAADRRARPSPRATRRASRRSSTRTSSRSSSRSSSSSSPRRASRASRSRSASARSSRCSPRCSRRRRSCCRCAARSCCSPSPRSARPRRSAALPLRLHGRVEVVLLGVGHDPADRRARPSPARA